MISKINNTLYSIILWPIWYAYLIIILPLFLIFIILVNKEYFHFFLRPMSYFFCLFGGQRLKVSGEIPDPKSGPYLYLMNHESLFDHFAIGMHIKHYVTAIAKFEQFKYPLWGHVAKYYGVEPINRSNTKKAIRLGANFLVIGRPITQSSDPLNEIISINSFGLDGQIHQVRFIFRH